MLSKYLDKDFAGFDNAKKNMMDWLLSKELLVSDFEKVLDELIGRVRGLGKFRSYLHLQRAKRPIMWRCQIWL